ncbi:MAG: hypothetical protein ABIQ93_01570, partial [Saprospiraceae bacterium]
DPYTTEPVWKAFEARFDTAGTLLWNRNYLQAVGGVFYDVTPFPDGGYFMVGNIIQGEFNQTAAWLLKTDAYGFAGTCPVTSDTLVTADAAVYQANQAFPEQAGLTAVAAAFPIVEVSSNPVLLCEKACPTNLEICNNNLDDDGDGLFDCLDPDCPCAEDLCRPKRNDYWFFGERNGLNFSTEPPKVLGDGQITGGWVSATISDNQGNLLLYTNGRHIYNRFHQLLPHGTNPDPQFEVSTANCLIIPNPGDAARYYVFTHDRNFSFSYSLVDMHLDNGRGDVVSTEHFVAINTPDKQMQGLTATRSCTFNGYWLAVYSYSTNQMIAYRIDQTGLHLTPVISPAGGSTPLFTDQIKFSPNGKQLARTAIGDSVLLYAFDLDISQAGHFSNLQKIKVGKSGQISDAVEYSPTSRYLYVTSYRAGLKSIYQFDLDLDAPTAISNSGLEIYAEINAGFTAMQLAPNGKIYLAHGPPFTTIDVIHHPEAPGLACQFQRSVAVLSSTPIFYNGLCNVIASDLRRPHIAFPADAPDSICTLNSPVFYQLKNVPCDVTAIDWSLVGLTGTVQSTYQYATVTYAGPGQGLLIVTAHTDCGLAADTLPVMVHAGVNQILNLGPDRTVCDNGVFTFHAGGGFAKYRWQNGSPDSVLTTLLPGKYWVDVYDLCGNRQTDTVLVQIAPTSVLILGPDRRSCPGTPETFERPAAFASWQWSPATALSCDSCAGISVDPATTTTWTVLAQTPDGCLSIDTLRWQIVDTLFAALDTSICVGQTVDFYGLPLPPDTTAH